MTTLRIPNKNTLLRSPTYDLQEAVDKLVLAISEHRQANPGSRAALPAGKVREACPDLPRGSLDHGGATWQLVRKAFEDHQYVVRYEECPGEDVVVFE